MKSVTSSLFPSIFILLLAACQSLPALQNEAPEFPINMAETIVEKTIPITEPYYIVATVWESEPITPILTYHRFKANRPSTLTLVSRLDFEEELQKLYDSGYVTISLERWLAGDMRVPDGKRPLVLSMDDLFYKNQITLTPDGNPSPESGLGVAWDFNQRHPDFGFHWALFASLGDKPYGEGSQAEQEIQLAKVIVWCLEHDAMIYNHTFRHANLNYTDGLGLTAELRSNDKRLRYLLSLVNRQELIPKLQNMLALPGGRRPRLADGQTALYDYIDPDGRNIQAIFNIDYISRPDFVDSPYSKSFKKWEVPRMVANLEAIDYLTENRDKFPSAQSCRIELPDEKQFNTTVHFGENIAASELPDLTSTYLASQIILMIKNGQCPPGVYATQKYIFSASANGIELIHSVNDNPGHNDS